MVVFFLSLSFEPSGFIRSNFSFPRKPSLQVNIHYERMLKEKDTLEKNEDISIC
jgi:hypothetical protein